MQSTDRLGITISVVALGLLVYAFIPLSSQGFILDLFGSELELRLSGMAQVAFVLVPLTCAGVDSMVRTHPGVRSRSYRYRVAFWMLPSLIVIAGFTALGRLVWWGYRLSVILLTGMALAAVMVLQQRSISSQDEPNRAIRVGLNGFSYAMALALFVALYESRQGGILSALGVLLVSCMLALELFRNAQGAPARTWLHVGLTGVLMGELAWALSYCSLEPAARGGFLLLAFYTLTGLIQQHLRGRLSRRVVVEFGAICIVGLLLLAIVA